MDFGTLNTMISENRIEDITHYALTLSEQNYDLFIDELIHQLVTTADNGCRNTIAIVLGDLHCDKAIEPLMELINNPQMSHCRGTLIYALENLRDCNRNLMAEKNTLLFCPWIRGYHPEDAFSTSKILNCNPNYGTIKNSHLTEMVNKKRSRIAHACFMCKKASI